MKREPSPWCFNHPNGYFQSFVWFNYLQYLLLRNSILDFLVDFRAFIGSIIYLGLEECTEICYKDPVFKDQRWSAYIDRSPGSPSHSKVFISYIFSLPVCVAVDFAV